MKSLLYPDPLSLSSFSSISTVKPPHLTPTFLKLPADHAALFAVRKPTLAVKVALDAVTVNQSGVSFDTRNPTVSSSYRDSNLPKPNPTVLEAQTRVCTGPTQTKPLSEDQALKVLDTILRSVTGELKDEEEPVSKAQLGAFFAAMTIRANCFPEATQWSDGETRAMNKYWLLLVRALPPDVGFIADQKGSLMGIGSSIGPQFVGNGASDMRWLGK